MPKPVNRIEIRKSSFEVITREDGIGISFAGKIVGVLSEQDFGYEITQGGRWVFRSYSLRSCANWFEEEILRRITR